MHLAVQAARGRFRRRAHSYVRFRPGIPYHSARSAAIDEAGAGSHQDMRTEVVS